MDFFKNLKEFADGMFQSGKVTTQPKDVVPRFVPRKESQIIDEPSLRYHLHFLTHQRLNENPNLLAHVGSQDELEEAIYRVMVIMRNEHADIFDRFDPAVMMTAIEQKRAIIDDYLRSFPERYNGVQK